MKKSICVMLAFVLVAFSVTACKSKKTFPQDITCESIMNAAQSVGEIPEAENIYLKSKDNLDGYSMSLWADGIFSECDELGLLGDYAIFITAGTETYELAILKAKSEDDLDAVEDLIERRKETLSFGDKGAYDPDFDVRMKNAVVYTDGLFVVFLITDYNDAAVKAIEALKK